MSHYASGSELQSVAGYFKQANKFLGPIEDKEFIDVKYYIWKLCLNLKVFISSWHSLISVPDI
jgi:hypothetical protein